MNFCIIIFCDKHLAHTASLVKKPALLLNINKCKLMLCLFELRTHSKLRDAACLVSTLKMQTEISSASGLTAAQAHPTRPTLPRDIPIATDFLFWASCYWNIAPVRLACASNL